MGVYKVFDGTNWVNICDCDVHIKTPTNWQLLDAKNCILRYWDGNQWCDVNCPQVITDETEINIWFDNSGSMSDTLPPLEEMRDTLLQTCLLSIYNNDVALYNERVRVLNMWEDIADNGQNDGSAWNYNERFIRCLATGRNFDRTPNLQVNQVINLTFADESDDYGYSQLSPPWDNSTRTSTYNLDISILRNLLTAETYAIKGCAFRINTGPNSFSSFRDLTEATFVDTGVYVPPFNLSDFVGNTFTYQLDTDASSTAAYYLSQITAALNSLGIVITC